MKKIEEFSQKISALLHARKSALSFDEIADALDVRGNMQKKLQKSLHDLMQAGQIVQIRDQRYAVGSAADLVTGTLQVLRSGHAIVAGADGNVFVPSQDQENALPDDRVLVRVTPGGQGDRPGMPNGRVIRILERARHEIVGTLKQSGRFLIVTPMDASYGRDFYVPDANGAQLQDRVICRFTNWADKHVNPEGVVIETIGPADDPSTDTLAIIKHYGLPEAFPPEVVREAETVSALSEQPGERRDCRGLVTFTIDPVRARDFDDALSLEPLADGQVELGVHIADVSHYVQLGSALDKEARQRGNSVYLPDKVIPMLPEQLSNGICSLRPNEDRLAFTAFMTLNAAGQVTSSRFAKTLIRSQARLTYEQAMTVINGEAMEGLPEGVRTRIIAVHALAQQLRKNRFARHALDLDMPECEIVMGPNGMIQDVRVVVNDASHQLVEECMVAANEAVARELTVKAFAVISRLHEPPRVEKIEELQIQLTQMGLKPGDLTNPRNMSRFLSTVKDEPLVMHIRMAVLRSLNRAVYSAEQGGHYGLAKTYYGHFTSPIRRYADLTVHRQLESLVGRRPLAEGESERGHKPRAAYSRKELIPVADNCSRTEQIADEAERALIEIKKYRYLEQQLKSADPQPMEGVVVAVMNFGLFVELVHLQLQGLVHISQLSNAFVRYDSAAQALKVGDDVYQVGSRMQVLAARVDFDQRKIDFVPAGGKVGGDAGIARSGREGRRAGGAGRGRERQDGPPRRDTQQSASGRGSGGQSRTSRRGGGNAAGPTGGGGAG
ncbi:MAG: ribonuclease R, partial [Verrucomicrobia bacterium]|nr:ribonuclease R [Verrucomicrobiota bacterium]